MEALRVRRQSRTIHVWPIVRRGALERVLSAVRQVCRVVGAQSALISSRSGRSRLITSRKLLVGVRDTMTMTWIMRPAFTVVAVVAVVVRSMAVEEEVIDEYRAAEPVRAPARATPETEVDARSPSQSVCRIVQRRVGTPHRMTPDVSRVIGHRLYRGWLAESR
jgi:hypothetical protein